MRKIDLIHQLAALDRRGIYVLSRHDIEKLFPDEGEKALQKSLQRMVADRLLVRVGKGLYLNPATATKSSYMIEDIARAMRPGCLSYVSLESILSEYGVISQIPMSRITLMTTGARGTYDTPFGSIEFTHTKRSEADILKRTVLVPGRPLRIAKKRAAVQDLLRVGRNVNLLDADEVKNLQEEEDE